MKLTLVLIVCFVGVTYQQGYAWPPLYNYSPRLFFYPGFNQINRYVDLAKPSNENLEHGYALDEEDSIPKIQARVPFGNVNKPQKKLFATSLFSNPIFPFNFRTLTVTTLTTTVLSTVSSTAVIATVQACIPASLFVTQAGLVTLTGLCARRKRQDSAKQIETGSEPSDDFITPSLVLPLEVTKAVLHSERDDSIKPEITSSYADLNENSPTFFHNNFNERQNRALNLIVTTTSLVTSYSFSTTTIKRTIALSGQNALSCLPIGYSVC